MSLFAIAQPHCISPERSYEYYSWQLRSLSSVGQRLLCTRCCSLSKKLHSKRKHMGAWEPKVCFAVKNILVFKMFQTL